jgi:uncharacterized flavoprotein (TIGR03862 family)
MAAESLQQAGLCVHVYDAMPSVGRKFLLAGKGGLNLTHSEAMERFTTRFGVRAAAVAPWLQVFGPEALRAWARALGIETFVGTSGRVFPTEMKAAPLLRAWLHRLRHPASGTPVQFHMRHRWTAWSRASSGGWQLGFDAPQGAVQVQADAVVLALGGASWPRLGSDGAWVPLLQHAGVEVAALRPANCGFDIQGGWSAHFSQHFAGAALKSVAIHVPDPGAEDFVRQGEFVATATGIEGSLVYAAAHLLRDAIAHHGEAVLHLDLLPAWTPERVLREVAHPRGTRSLSGHLKGRLGLAGVKTALLYESLSRAQMQEPATLAATIKRLPLRLSSARPLAEAISTAGGVRLESLDANLMVRALPGVAVAGEMLDWEAPTGGYLLTASMASGRVAADGVVAFLRH